MEEGLNAGVVCVNYMRTKILKLLRGIEKKQTFKDHASSVTELYDPENSSYEEYVEYQQKNDQEHLLKYDYEKVLEDEVLHSVRLFLFFPNYRFIIDKFNSEYDKDTKLPPLFHDRAIRAELRRMEADKLITIGTQEVSEYCLKTNGDFSTILGDGWKSKTESIILTTKGKSYWEYVRESARENPIPTGISIISLIISITVAIYK